MQQVHDLVMDVDVRHRVLSVRRRVASVSIVGDRALPSREFTDEVAVL